MEDSGWGLFWKLKANWLGATFHQTHPAWLRVCFGEEYEVLPKIGAGDGGRGREGQPGATS